MTSESRVLGEVRLVISNELFDKLLFELGANLGRFGNSLDNGVLMAA